MEETLEQGLAATDDRTRRSTLAASIGDVLLDLLKSPSPTFVLTSPAEVSYGSHDPLYDMEDESMDNEEDYNDDIFGVSNHGRSSFRPIRTERYPTSEELSPAAHLRPRPRSTLGETVFSWTSS
jgi:hypothetical protein